MDVRLLEGTCRAGTHQKDCDAYSLEGQFPLSDYFIVHERWEGGQLSIMGCNCIQSCQLLKEF